MSDTSIQPDAIQLLTTDHSEVEAMFRQIESLPENDERGKIVDDVVRELSVHAAIEEQVLYPVMRKELPDGETLVQGAIDEHQKVKETLAAIERADGPVARDQLLVRLMGDVRHHVEEEETELFPNCKRRSARPSFRRWAPTWRRPRRWLPPHPHPNAPNTPPGNLVGGVAAAVMDRARGALGRD